MAQRTNLPQTKILENVEELYALLQNEEMEVMSVAELERVMEVRCKKKDGYDQNNGMSNPVLAGMHFL